MKVYISGRISGLPAEEAMEIFGNAEALLCDIGLEPVNPMKNGLTGAHSWEQHMVRDIELLFSCDAILMLSGWIDSVGASIEYDIANRTGKRMFFETQLTEATAPILRIQNAIFEVTGLKFHEYNTKSRNLELFFSRMIFVHHCCRYNIPDREIARYMRRDRTSVCKNRKKYIVEFEYNPYFRTMANRVNEILIND